LLVAGADLFREKSTAGWLLVAGLFREKSTVGWWLISQANRTVGFHVEVHCSSRAVGCGLCTLHLEISSQEFACNLGVYVKKKKENLLATTLLMCV
jgi:hypothetical protein